MRADDDFVAEDLGFGRDELLVFPGDGEPRQRLAVAGLETGLGVLEGDLCLIALDLDRVKVTFNLLSTQLTLIKSFLYKSSSILETH